MNVNDYLCTDMPTAIMSGECGGPAPSASPILIGLTAGGGGSGVLAQPVRVSATIKIRKSRGRIEVFPFGEARL
jgi:hypothetical protein